MAESYDEKAILGRELKSILTDVASEIKKKLDIDDVVTVDGTATFDAENHRLIFNNIIFDSIYPVVGKYGLAVFPENTDAPDATESAGDPEWLLDWRPYLVDMSAVTGETAKTPVASLQRDNWLRSVDGSFAPVCGVKSTQADALNNLAASLYWNSAKTNLVTAICPGAYDASGNFQAEYFWNYVKDNLSAVNAKAGVTYSCPIEVKLYSGSATYEYGAYTDYHIPAPWETTETKYSVFVGRASDVYVVDGYSETTGEHMRGLAAKAVPVGSEGFDPEFYRLHRTGISPGPSTTVGGKVRNFFYNYKGADSNTAGHNGTASTGIFYNNGTYPRTNDATQYSTASWSRACNANGTTGVPVPVSEMGYHAMNAFLCSLEAAYGTRNLWAANRFSEGVSANFSASAANGGVSVDGTWKKWDTSESTLGVSGNYSVTVNNQYAKFQCMEPQIAASLATEMGIAAGASFHWNGGDWHYEVPSGIGDVVSLGEGAMNCRIYKLTDSKTVNSHAVRCNLVCALAEGVNPVGDIWWYCGGGSDLVYLTNGTTVTSYKYWFYLEPDQSKWLAGTEAVTSNNAYEKHTDGTAFTDEGMYTCLVDNSDAGGTGNTYCRARTGYTPVRRVSGGGNSQQGECCYQYRQIDDDAKGSSGIRSRRRLMFRGIAAATNCSPRYLFSNNRPSSAYVVIGCAAQVLLA